MPEPWRRAVPDAPWKVVLNYEDNRVVVFKMERGTAGTMTPTLSAAKFFDKDVDVVSLANMIRELRTTIAERAEFTQALDEQLKLAGEEMQLVVERDML